MMGSNAASVRGAGILPAAQAPGKMPGPRGYAPCLGVVVTGLALLLVGCGEKKETGEQSSKREGGVEKVYERGPLKVVLWLDNPEPTIADRITLEMEMTSDEAYEVTPPAFGEKLEQFGITDFRSTPPELVGDGKVRESRTYELEPFLSGEYTIPPMTFRFAKKDGSDEEPHELETEELTVTVSSLLPEDAENLEIHEIAPPVELPKPTPAWLWPTVAGIGAVVLTALGMIFWPRRKAAAQVVPPRPAHEIAFGALAALVAEDLPGKGEVKAFYQRISDILRHYIENRFGLHAPERTTEEFLSELGAGQALEAGHKALLGRFLHHCDLVKFAEHQPTRDDIQSTFDSCKNFILETKQEAPALRAA